MKNLVLSLCLLVLIGWSSALFAAPVTEPATAPEAAPQEVEVVQEETLEAVEAEATIPALCEASTSMFPGPNYCGDPYSPEGSMVGCIDTSGPFWKRVICTCSNGYLVC